jgi:hypothetical protein
VDIVVQVDDVRAVLLANVGWVDVSTASSGVSSLQFGVAHLVGGKVESNRSDWFEFVDDEGDRIQGPAANILALKTS